jgi:hypothetical protein
LTAATSARGQLGRGDLALAILAVLVLGFALTLLDLGGTGDRHGPSRALVARLGLTDLALFAEARYTRNPSQADRHAAFQDQPCALEHFPTGSLVSPPAQLHYDHLAPEATISY